MKTNRHVVTVSGQQVAAKRFGVVERAIHILLERYPGIDLSKFSLSIQLIPNE